MRDPDEVRLVLDAQEFTGWTGVSVIMAIDTLADAFTLSAPFDPDNSRLVAAIKPYRFQPVKIYIGDDLYHSGRLDAVAFSLSADGRTMSLSGRSLPGVLCDASVKDCAELLGLTFAQIAAKVCKPFGISIRDDAYDVEKIETARPNYGDTAFDFLHSLAAPHNLLLNSSYSGALVISKADSLTSNPIRAALREGDPTIMEIGTSFDGTKRQSEYTVATQFADEPDITGTVTDPEISLYRPRLQGIGETDTDPRTSAARMMSEAIAASMSISVKLSGWRRPDGGLWSERQAVTLHAPSVYLSKTARYVISTATLTLDAKEGRTVTLSLTPPEVYSGTLIKAGKAGVNLW